MKKALVLGVLTFFVINIATVQTANAQDKKAAPAKTVKADANKKVVKPKTASFQSEKKAVKCEQKVEVKQDPASKKVVTPAKPSASKEVDNTSKKVKNEIGVPPTPNKTKQAQSSTTKPNAGGEK